jgi:CRISPR-associated protein Cas2
VKHHPKAWLVAYDIRDDRRLRRLHRQMRKLGVPAQYSVFVVEADDVGIRAILQRIGRLIDESVDDVRAYHLPETATVWSLGTQQWPDGLVLAGTHAARMLAATATTGGPAEAPAGTPAPSTIDEPLALATPLPTPHYVEENRQER